MEHSRTFHDSRVTTLQSSTNHIFDMTQILRPDPKESDLNPKRLYPLNAKKEPRNFTVDSESQKIRNKKLLKLQKPNQVQKDSGNNMRCRAQNRMSQRNAQPKGIDYHEDNKLLESTKLASEFGMTVDEFLAQQYHYQELKGNINLCRIVLFCRGKIEYLNMTPPFLSFSPFPSFFCFLHAPMHSRIHDLLVQYSHTQGMIYTLFGLP